MRRTRYRWMWGLPVVAVIWLLSVIVVQQDIRLDLKVRAEQSLRQAGLGWAAVAVDGRDARLIGEAYSEQERGLARRILAKTWGVANVTDGSRLAEAVPNYVWTAEVNGAAIKLTGYFPSQTMRRRIVQAARDVFPKFQVADRMRPARGAPADDVWMGGINFGLAQLSRLERGGAVNLHGTKLAVAGVANSVTAYRSIKGALYRDVPSGIVLIKDTVQPPTVFPFEWRASFKNNQLVLEGYVPSEQERDSLAAVAKEVFKNSPIVDKMAVAAGAPVGWLSVATMTLRHAARLQEATAVLSNTKLTISGQAQKQKTAEDVRTGLQASLTKKYSLTHKILYQEPTIPTIQPFVTTITSDGRRLRFSGYTPGEAQSKKAVAFASGQRPKMEIIDAMTRADGAPKGWQSCVVAGLTGLLKLENGRVEVSNRKLLLEGLTRDEAIGEALPKEVRAAANRDCDETLDVKIEVPPEPELTWEANFDGQRLRIAGEIPNSAIQAELDKAAKSLFPKAEHAVDLRVVPAPTKKWPKVAMLAFNQLAKLRIGTAKITGQLVTLSGEAPDTVVATAIKKKFEASIPKDYRANLNIEVKSAAMLWAEQAAKRKQEEAAAAAAKQAAEKERLAREAAAEAEKVRQQRLAEEARQKAEEARRKAEAERLARERDEQRKADEAARIEQQRQVQRLARERCQEAINGAVSQGTITFARGSAALDERSYPTLDRLAGLSGLCRQQHIEIGGHTDSFGSEERNRNLSHKRAESVMSYLVEKGMSSKQLSVSGYGESQPIVPNNSSQNRARNRRIEFKVRVN